MRSVYGTTLVEAVVGMAILTAVSLFAYTGISTGANLIQKKGADRARAREAAEAQLASVRQTESGEDVRLSVIIRDENGNKTTAYLDARRIQGTDETQSVTLYGYLAEDVQ